MIVLDTHTLIWWMDGTLARRSRRADSAIKVETEPQSIAVSAITVWEITRLVDRNRLGLSTDIEALLTALSESDPTTIIPIDAGIAVESLRLPGDFHADPADRMIVATARRLGVPLVTGDAAIRAYPHVRTIW